MKLNITEKFTNEQKHIIILIAFTILGIVILGCIIYPTIKYINTINEDTLQLRTHLEKKYESVMRLHNSKQKINEIREHVDSYSNYIFKPGDELKLITLLESIAGSHNLEQQINNTNLDKISGQQINFDMSVTGRYNDVLAYLAALEHSKYFFNIGSINISPAAIHNNSDTNSLTTAHITLLLYVNQ